MLGKCFVECCQNLAVSALDRASAMEARGVEHLVILQISKLQPIPAATVAIALVRVFARGQEVLYPFFHMKTDPALSIHTRTGLLRQR